MLSSWFEYLFAAVCVNVRSVVCVCCVCGLFCFGVCLCLLCCVIGALRLTCFLIAVNCC